MSVNFIDMNKRGEYSINIAINGFNSCAMFAFTHVSVANASMAFIQFIKRCSIKIMRSFLFVINLQCNTFFEEF